MEKALVYYRLTKPGIIRGNCLTVIGGYLLASKGNISLTGLIAVVSGSALIIASGCVLNNYIDRGIDKKMKRTKSRALASGKLTGRTAIPYGAILGITGFSILAIWTNWLTVAVGATGYIFYVVFYSIWKRRSPIGTLVGSVSGAVPPVAGYAAVTNQIDIIAVLLFLTLTFWQMPHFYAIALYRSKDYAAAKIPVLPLVQGVKQTQIQMIIYTIGFIMSATLLGFVGGGILYTICMLILGSVWLRLMVKGLVASDVNRWAHQVFGFSLLTLTVFSALISLSGFLF